ESFTLRYSQNVKEALERLSDCFTITDPCICGHPIVFASKDFLKMVGYTKDEVIGRNGRMFQGPETDRRSVLEIREAIREERAVEVSLLNYNKDGKPFWMLFKMCPVFIEEDGSVINFVSVQVPILRKLRLLEHGEERVGISGSAFKCCRRDFCANPVVRQHSHPPQLISSSNDEAYTSGSCEASEVEKAKASAAISTILSVLTQYSEFTGTVISTKRCCLSVNQQLASSLNVSLGRIEQSFVLTDAILPDMPIVFANEAFLRLTGYSRNEVMGRNCRFLCGNETAASSQYEIKQSIEAERACTVTILNYRKDGSSFWNSLHISPVRNAAGKVAFFVGVQVESEWPGEVQPERRQLGVVAAVKVAVRGFSL
ncbi:pac motif-containing protein, partial [Genlisea aurea]